MLHESSPGPKATACGGSAVSSSTRSWCAPWRLPAAKWSRRSSTKRRRFEEVSSYPSPTDVPQNIEPFEVGKTPEEPSELSVDTLMLEPPGPMIPEEKASDDGFSSSDTGGGIATASNDANLGGLGGFDVKSFGFGPAFRGKGGVGVGVGSGTHAARGGDEFGFAGATPTGGRPCWAAAAAPSNRSGPWRPP